VLISDMPPAGVGGNPDTSNAPDPLTARGGGGKGAAVDVEAAGTEEVDWVPAPWFGMGPT
jgi:hypothetical protein